MFLADLGTTMMIVWFSVIVLAGIIEASSMNLTSIWFSAGGIVAFIISLIWPEAYVAQFIAFIAVSSLLLFELRPALKGYLNKNDVKTNADRVIGKIAVCTKSFKTGDRGEVKIDGKFWTAISNEDIELNDKVEVLSIDGVKLVVRKAE